MGQHDPVTYKYFLLKLQNHLFRNQAFPWNRFCGPFTVVMSGAIPTLRRSNQRSVFGTHKGHISKYDLELTRCTRYRKLKDSVIA